MPSQNKIELNELTQVVHKEHAFLVALNENFLRLQQAINDTLSRSGVVPNQMEEVLDMNGKRVINVGEAVEDTDAVTRAFIKDLIADVEAAVSRLNTLVEQAKEALAVYAAEYILPPAIAARDDAIAAKNAAKGYYDDTKALYDQLESLATNLNALLAVASDITNINAVAGDLTNIDTLAAVSSAITTCANNIAVILAAPTYAANAETWAEGSDADVAALGGTHSAKGWAQSISQGFVPVTRTINGKALSSDIVLTAQDVGALQPGEAIKSTQVTIAVSDWSGNTATKTVAGVTSSSDVFVSPEPVLANIKAYAESNVFCSALGTDTVTFTCETVPAVALTVNIGVN